MQRILFYVQSLLGRGHLVRSAHLAEALRDGGKAEGFELLLADGGGLLPPLHKDIRRLRLPEVRAADSRFSALITVDGKELDSDTRERRATMLRQAYEEFRPHIIIVESYPLARRAFAFELDGLLQKAADDKVLRISSVRDIVVFNGSLDKQKRILQKLALIDKVWVHGDEAFCPLRQSLPFADEFTDKIIYSGYITGPSVPPAVEREELVVVSGGGGAVAEQLYKSLLAQARQLSQYRWLFLLGENFPKKQAFVAQTLPPHITCGDNVADFQTLLRTAKIGISQAGYNTVCDFLATATPSLLQAFSGDDGSETEQPLRAELLRQAGVCGILPPDFADWTAEQLAETIEATARQSQSAPFAFASADKLTRQLQELWSRHVE